MSLTSYVLKCLKYSLPKFSSEMEFLTEQCISHGGQPKPIYLRERSKCQKHSAWLSAHSSARIKETANISQTMDIADMAIHPVVCQKSDFHGNSDFQSSQKLDPLKMQAKNSGQNMLAFQRYFGARNGPMVHYKSRRRYSYAIWFV
jgi:hypothetical protein